jgi:hypothetical protein
VFDGWDERNPARCDDHLPSLVEGRDVADQSFAAVAGIHSVGEAVAGVKVTGAGGGVLSVTSRWSAALFYRDVRYSI